MQTSQEDFRNVDQKTAAELLAAGKIDVLDVRTSEEFQQLGHIPSATLLPLDLIASGAATLHDRQKPLLIVCEHGIRSVQAARFLSAAGFSGLLNLVGGMAAWSGPRDYSAGVPFGHPGPSSWLLENADLLPRDGFLLDLACGRGRHALLLAAAGFRIRAIDRDAEKIAALNQQAKKLELSIEADVDDLEVEDKSLGSHAYDVILGIHYLHRALFPALIRAIRPGGILLYETFTVAQAARGKPTNPDYLLKPGELIQLVAPLTIERKREGEFDGVFVAGVAARRE